MTLSIYTIKLSNEDIFHIPGVYEIIMNYKKDIDVVLKYLKQKRRKRVEMRNCIASINHINRLSNKRIYK